MKATVQRLKRPPFELLIIAIAAVVLSVVGGVRFAPTAHAATCPTGNGHCYAAALWPGTNLGQSARLKTVGLFSVNDGFNHISEEIWVIDTTRDCNGTGESWLEAGEATERGATGNWYFWGSCPPGGTPQTWFEYQPPSGDVGQFQHYTISGIAGSNAWSITMQNPADAFQWGANATLTLTPNNLQTGLETTNNSFSITHADPDTFITNQFKDAHTGVFTAQTNPGQPPTGYSNNPPVWTWVTAPAPGGTGGTGQTTCC